MANISALFDAYSIPDSGVEGLNMHDRFRVLKKLGLLAHETEIGQPKRPFDEWSPNELALALKVFQTWPEFEETEKKYQDVGILFAKNFVTPEVASREALLSSAAKALKTATKEVYGPDFPDVKIKFVRLTERENRFYAGLNPEDEVEFNINRLHDDRINGSDFEADAAYIELLCHEVTHLIQRHAAQQSDGRTENGDLSALVAEAFYEAIYDLPKEIKPLYTFHPWESEARKQASKMTAELIKIRPELNSTGQKSETQFDMKGIE